MKMNQEERQKMINALIKFKEAANEISYLWESTDGSGETPFDETLTKYYPFHESFFEMGHDINNWATDAIEDLKKMGS